MTLRRFLDEAANPDRSLIVLNRTAPEPIQRMLDELFDRQSVDVEELDLAGGDEDRVLVVEGDDVVASSPLEELERSILFVNSDLFVTGTRGIEDVELPSALKGLDEIPFYLRGYPESNSEKLLLILISRYIERTAWEERAGTLRSSFQNLARIEDEIGTNEVYRRLDDTDVDVHVYGAPGWEPTPEMDITIHAGYERDFVDSWFVVFTPPDGSDDQVALLALEEAPNEWVGFWTFRESMVNRLNEYIERRL